jgi:hypothetical protein
LVGISLSRHRVRNAHNGQMAMSTPCIVQQTFLDMFMATANQPCQTLVDPTPVKMAPTERARLGSQGARLCKGPGLQVDDPIPAILKSMELLLSTFASQSPFTLLTLL